VTATCKSTGILDGKFRKITAPKQKKLEKNLAVDSETKYLPSHTETVISCHLMKESELEAHIQDNVQGALLRPRHTMQGAL
jgi:hypothetical protein